MRWVFEGITIYWKIKENELIKLPQLLTRRFSQLKRSRQLTTVPIVPLRLGGGCYSRILLQ
ncbi:hypothetical protein [Coleofasciculus sp. FACHB-1120]|uniref:hypothetical protein n=1 Tax=Coleofasciculus sp. FACHB-1120 TaxID=2692783 RepID=UPI001689B2AD|nr:hypothetical protein [Coleofasciculus sp. FACHB-1120]MBD2742647.1 hypothetical protein [Coleofasciculus sp. FACHB-1120]